MSFPTNNIHRRNRRKLGRGQYPALTGATAVITGASNHAILTFTLPVVVDGPIPLVVTGGTAGAQTIVSPTVVNIEQGVAVTGKAWTLAQPIPQVGTYEGGTVASAPSGTF